MFNPMQTRMDTNQLVGNCGESEPKMDILDSMDIQNLRITKDIKRRAIKVSSSIIKFNSLLSYRTEKFSLSNEYHYADIENITFSFMLAAMYGMLIKVVSNMISEGCFMQSECDCRANSYGIKLWTLYLADHEAILLIIVLYYIAPETGNYGRNCVLGLIAFNILIIVVLAANIPGDIEAYNFLKYSFVILNTILQFGLNIFYFYKAKIFWKFINNYGSLWFFFIFLFQVLTFLSPYLSKIGLMIKDSEMIFLNSFHGLILIGIYALFTILMPKFLQKMQLDYTFHKFITAIDITYLSLAGLALGLLFNTRIGYWPFIFYLIVYLMNSFEIQTGIITIVFFQLIFLFKKKICRQSQLVLSTSVRSLTSKLKGGRHIFFTFSIGLRLFIIALSKQWTDHFQGYSSGCNFNIPNTSDITFTKVGILFLCDMFINGICYYINKRNGFVNIRYENPKRDLLLEALLYYFYGFLIETRIKSLLANT